MEGRLLHLLHLVRTLVGCEEAYLVLRGPEPALAHPLLEILFPNLPHVVPSSKKALFYDKHLSALVDLVLQQGRMYCQNGDTELLGAESLVLLPLEQPAGQLGLLLLRDKHALHFQEGERRLLEQYGRIVAQRVEELLSERIVEAMSGITEVKVAEKQELFLSIVGHELRTPLTAIKGYASLLQAYGSGKPVKQGEAQRGVLTENLQRQYLRALIEQVSHLESVMSDVLALSRVQSGRLHLRCSPVNIPALCAQTTQIMQMQSEPSKRFVITQHCSFQTLNAWADPSRVQQILTNLLENAMKYSPRGGKIELFVYESGLFTEPQRGDKEKKMISVSVRDYGIGIPSAQQARLFEPFSRGELARASQAHGLGLGLYITRKLVEAMGGSISLSSSYGVGTRVTFTLPQYEGLPDFSV